MQSIPTNLKDECCSPPNLHLRSVSALSGLPPTPGSRQPAEPRSAEDLLPIVYEELRRIAAHKLARQTPGVTLQPTALVHEAWLRMTRNDPTGFAGRAHFFAAAETRSAKAAAAWCTWPSRRNPSAAAWRSRSSSWAWTPGGRRPLRGRAPGAGDDGPSQHRQGLRRRRHRHRPAVTS
jgi:hypothetical protein